MAVPHASGAVSASPLTPALMPAMRAALQKAALPADDLEAPGVVLFSFARDGQTVGYGGLVVCGGDALLRSIVVDPDHRSKGVGRSIVELLLGRVGELGAQRSYLLTSSATEYFELLGFTEIDRRDAPASILATRQMQGLCPASAILMTKSPR
jgi:N-acetylglutamate synthase-like GNAT family acetyltransferase